MADMVKRKDFLENEVVDLTEEIKLVSPTDTPLTTMLMGRGAVEPATDITVTWRERELNPNRGTLKLEGAEAGEVITSTRGSLSNVCQIIEKVTQVSGTARALHPKGGLGEDDIAVSVFHRVYGCRRPGQFGYRAGIRAGAGRLLEAVFCRHRTGNYDVGRGVALRSPGGAFEP